MAVLITAMGLHTSTGVYQPLQVGSLATAKSAWSTKAECLLSTLKTGVLRVIWIYPQVLPTA